MAFPFDPDVIKRNLRSHGFSSQQAAIVTHLALDKLRELHGQTNQPVTLERIAEAIKQYAAEEVAREKAVRPEIRDRGISILQDMEEDLQHLRSLPKLDTQIVKDAPHDGKQSKRFRFDDDGLEYFFGKEDPYHPHPPQRRRRRLDDCAPASNLSTGRHHSRDLITALCARTEIAVELGKHLRPEDLVALYATSRVFHEAINEHLLSSIRTWIEHQAPEAGRIFKYKLYRRHLIPDPAGRTWAAQYQGTSTEREKPRLMRQVRTVPGLRYLQLVLGRDRCCRQIVAIMARNGFLVPKTMHHTLLRLWLLMDIPTTGQRQALLRNADIWTDQHLYNAQMLFLKLSMMFNDPIYGPLSNELVHVALGQKGLYPLWQLLMHKRFTTLPELLEWKVRYDYDMPDELHGGGRANESTVHGVPIHEVGIGHLEGWGLGDLHLQRPDELVPVEAIARGLALDDHLVYMMLWGYIDFETGENMVPTEQDMYMSDEEDALQHMDTTGHWKTKHALKKRFAELTPLQQQQIMDDDEDDRLRALAWVGDTTEPVVADPGSDAEPYTLDDEIRRGYIVRRRSANPSDGGGDGAPVAQPPGTNDTQGWEAFVQAALATVPVELDEDQALRAQAFESYHVDELHSDWDWGAWLAEREARGHSAEGFSLSSTDEDEDDAEKEEEKEEEEGGDDGEDDDHEKETIILDDPSAHEEKDESHPGDDHENVPPSNDDGIADAHNNDLGHPTDDAPDARLALLLDAAHYFHQDSTTAPGTPLGRLLAEHAPELAVTAGTASPERQGD
ncbi:hypothetical protein E4U42_004758 [Claviceps africana]|uniref:Uncharacterized protein n=1 Tax=Claviceps africana TaxID=83212 RepID=A0A8K0NG02_9HYPO|nr:hypothetical protein E4U42_004758 [Claviceps africana]